MSCIVGDVSVRSITESEGKAKSSLFFELKIRLRLEYPYI